MTETLPKTTQRLLLLANISMIVLIVVDLFYLTEIIRVADLPLFTLANLVVLGLGLWSFKVKRDLKARKAQPDEVAGGSAEKT